MNLPYFSVPYREQQERWELQSADLGLNPALPSTACHKSPSSLKLGLLTYRMKIPHFLDSKMCFLSPFPQHTV